jgi:DNA-binding transcriptional LysR family regulator
VELQNRNTPDQFVELREGRLHVGFVAMPPQDPTLVGRLVMRESLVVAFPEGHRFARFAKVPLGELADEPYTGFPRRIAPVPYDIISGLCRKAGFTLNVRHEADHVDSVLGLISAGIGVSVVPASYQQVHRPGIRYRPLPDSDMPLQIVVAWRRDNTLPALQKFLDVVRERTAQLVVGRIPPGREGRRRRGVLSAALVLAPRRPITATRSSVRMPRSRREPARI